MSGCTHMVSPYTFCIVYSRRFVKDKRPAFIKAKTNKKKAAHELMNALANEMSLEKEQAKKKQPPKDPWADEDASKLFCDDLLLPRFSHCFFFCLIHNWALFFASVFSCCPHYLVCYAHSAFW